MPGREKRGAAVRRERLAPRSGTAREELKRPWREFLRKKNLNDSKAREAVVDVFLGVSEHLDLQHLYELARQRNPHVGFATVYRTMKLLEEAGMAEVRHFGSQRGALYEVAAGKSHHDHLICESCGTIVEFVSEEVEALQDVIAEHHGFVLSRHRHELYGLCPRCAAEVRPVRSGA
jgi:Fur family transcriptional regulator, ferric uptake regulator